MIRAAPAVLATAALCACMPRSSATGDPRADDVSVGGARFRVRYWPGDEGAARRVMSAIEQAVPRVRRWGDLPQPITLTVQPSHDALEAAADRRGYAWLHAWATYQTVDLQSPRTWGEPVPDRKLVELLTHELTHCAMYQLAGDDQSWMYKQIPVWFGEGIASVAAAEHPEAGLEELRAFWEAKLPASTGEGGREAVAAVPVALPGDPIIDPGPIYREQFEVVYGAAHHAARFLIERYGEGKVRRVLALMGQGRRFPAAFKEAIGLSEAEFASDFRRYVVWQGWRR